MYNFEAPLFWYKFVFLGELLVAEFLITYTLKKKERIWVRLLLSVIALAAVTFALPIFSYNAAYSSLLFIIIFILSIFSMRFCLDEPPRNIIFCALLAYITQHIAYELSEFVMLIMNVDGTGFYGSEYSGQNFALQALITLICFAIVYWLVWALVAYRIRRQEDLQIDNQYLLIIAAFVLLFDIILNAVVVYSGETEAKILLLVLRLYNVLSCILAVFFQCFMLEQKKLKEELHTMESLFLKDSENYKIRKENIELINIRCHDLRHRIRAVRKSGTFDEKELRDIEQSVDIYGSFVSTGNEALDIILSDGNIYCKKNDITFICMAEGSLLNHISPTDIYSLFENAFHNAINAALEIEEKERRIIRLYVNRMEDMISIHMENYYSAGKKIKFIDGLPQTDKQDKRLHGFGVRSMKMIVEKLGGNISMRVNEAVFSLDIILPVAETDRNA